MCTLSPVRGLRPTHQGFADGVEQCLDGEFGIAVRELAEAGGKLFNEIGSGHNKMFQ